VLLVLPAGMGGLSLFTFHLARASEKS
jgi:hypothetical protein